MKTCQQGLTITYDDESPKPSSPSITVGHAIALLRKGEDAMTRVWLTGRHLHAPTTQVSPRGQLCVCRQCDRSTSGEQASAPAGRAGSWSAAGAAMHVGCLFRAPVVGGIRHAFLAPSYPSGRPDMQSRWSMITLQSGSCTRTMQSGLCIRVMQPRSYIRSMQSGPRISTMQPGPS
jgi:hypothetical protein